MYAHRCIRVCIMYVCFLNICMHRHNYVCVGACIYTYVCMHISIHVFAYVICCLCPLYVVWCVLRVGGGRAGVCVH